MANTELAKLLNLQMSQPEQKAEMSQNDMLAQAIIGLAPILAGAALGGAQGGAAGAQAGLTGLQAIKTGKKEAEEKAEKLATKRKEALTQALALSKEERAEKAAQRAEERQIAELGLKRKELQLKEADTGKGTKLTSEQTQVLAGFDSANKQIEEIEKRIQENIDIMGPITGIFSGKAGYGTKAKAFDARMKLAAQDIGTALERGKLTDADIDRYRQMLPNLRDTPEVAREKAILLRELIATKRAATIEAMGSGGYNVSKIAPLQAPITQQAVMPTSDKSPRLLDKLPSGLGLRDAEAAPMTDRQKRIMELRKQLGK
jgi:hypothetical protein